MAFFGMGGGPGNPGGGSMRIYLEAQKNVGRKPMRARSNAWRKRSPPYTFQVVLVLSAILLTTVLGLVNPLLISVVFDDAIGKGNVRLLLILTGIMFAIPILTGLIGIGQTYLNNLIGQKVMRDFRNQLYIHLQSMSLRFFTSTRTGEIQSRLSNDVNGVQGVITTTATSMVSNISGVLSTIVAMLSLSPLLTLISLGLLPLFLWITYKVGKVRRGTSKETQESMARLSAMMQETLSVSGMLLMKTFGRQQYAKERFASENQRLTDLEVRQQMIGRWFIQLTNVFFSISPVMVYLVAGLQIIHNPGNPVMTVGKVVAFTTLQNRLYFPLSQLLSIQVDIQGALALFDRIFEYLDLPIEVQNKPGALRLHSGAWYACV